ncbi:MAG: vanadium-dependent haloperoxidase [Ginsengibacter sp.]
MQNIVKKLMPFISLIILIATGCRKQDQIIPKQRAIDISSELKTQKDAGRFDSYVAQSWYSLMMKLIIETPGHTPPIAARSFGYTGVALYESLVGERPQHHSLVGQLNGLSSIPQRMYGNSYIAPITANAALARIVKDLFQNASAANMGRIDSLELANNNLYAKHFNEKIMDRSRDYGRAVANAVFKWSLTDGGHQAYLHNFPSDYIPPAGIDKWIPTPPAYLPAMLPYWGNNRVMLTANGIGPIDPPNPVVFSTTPGSAFYNAALEVYITSSHLSAEQNTIALYWADASNTFTPPGHNIAITLQLIRNHHLNLNEASVLLAKVGIALNDGGIVCWRAKYRTNLLRPITYIQTYIDPTFTTHIPTPPFPSYTSGHSTFSGAAAGIFSADIGSNVAFIDSTKMADGFSPRSFSNFTSAAQEAALSRLYGGIHYTFDNDAGFICGQLIAANVERLNW